MTELKRFTPETTAATDVLRMPDSFPGMFHVTDMRGRILQVSDD